MSQHQVALSGPANEELCKLQERLEKAFDEGTPVGNWRPSKSKIIEFLIWVYAELCAKPSKDGFGPGDFSKFKPIDAAQGRKVKRPTMTQVSIASKILRDQFATAGEPQRMPTQRELEEFIQRNNDIGHRWE